MATVDMLLNLLQCLLLCTVTGEELLEKISCANGSMPTAVLVTPLGGGPSLIQKSNYLIDRLLVSTRFSYPTVTFASFVSRNGKSNMDTPFYYYGDYNVTEFATWDWCDVDSYSRAALILNWMYSFSQTEDELRIEKRFIFVVIDSRLNESKTKFFQYLGELRNNDTVIIPIDATEANGRYEIDELARAGGYSNTGCLFCGGLTEQQLMRCEEELRQTISCQT